MPKFPVGPTSSRPGPILLKVAATAVKFVIRLKSSKAIRNMEDAKISIYTMKKIFVERTTSCGMALDAEKYEAPCGLFCRESGFWIL